jgi:hypothetical protein
MKFFRSRWLAGITAATIVFGVAFAAAASLNVTSDSLAAGQTAVVSCQTGAVNTSYTTSYDVTVHAYVVNTVTVSGVSAACNNLAASVTIEGPSGTPYTYAATAATGSFDVSVTDVVLAKDVVSVAVAISG